MADVTKKIKNIRTQYQREKRKSQQRKSGQGTDDVYVPTWPHFPRLKFLNEFLTAKQTTSNLKVKAKFACEYVLSTVTHF